MSDLERTPVGLQLVIPGCERRTLLRSTTRVDDTDQGLLGLYSRRASARAVCEMREYTVAAKQGAEAAAEERVVRRRATGGS
jgi:hypothetical protein